MLEDEAHPAVAHVSPGRVLTLEEHLAGVGFLEPGDDAQQARLARARGAEEGHQLAGGYGEAHVVDGDEVAELLRHVADFDAHG